MKQIRRNLVQWLNKIPEGTSRADLLQTVATLFILLCEKAGKKPRDVLDSNVKMIRRLERHPELRAIRMYVDEELAKQPEE